MLIDFRQLFPRWDIKPTGVLHIGANIGEEAPVYHELGIKKVLWVEANPNLMEKLFENIGKFEGQRAFNFAAGDKDWEEVKLHISNNAGQSSSVLNLGTHKIQHPDVYYTHDVTVQMFTVKKFFSTWGSDNDLGDVDFLNVDIQGAELMALRGMGDVLNNFKWLYLEVNKAEVYEGCPHVSDLDLFLNGFGFKRVETHSWIGDWSDALYIKK